MAQRSVEVVIGRLATDESFRAAFRRDPCGTLHGLPAHEIVLTSTERDALVSTPPTAWDAIAQLSGAGVDEATIARMLGANAATQFGVTLARTVGM